MRQIYCADKECELLPPDQTGSGSLGEHIVTTGSTGGLIPEAQATSVPLEPVKKPKKKKKKKIQKGGAKRPVKRLKKVQIGGRKKKK